MFDDDLIEQAKELRATNRIGEAETICRRILSHSPTNAKALNVLGTLCFMTDRKEDGFRILHLAEEFQPDFPDLLYNLGFAYALARNNEKAEHYYRLAIKYDPDYAPAWTNLGGLLIHFPCRLEESEACYRRVVEIKQGDPEEYYSFGRRLLLMGRFIDAWPYCEYRYAPDSKEKNTVRPQLSFPQWNGEPLVGKSLLLCPEQGFGDYIQFIRYASLLKERGLDFLTIFCHPALKPLLETMAGVDKVVSDLAAVSRHDYWSFPLSLPLHFNTSIETIPASIPYLRALPARIAKWHDTLQMDSLKIGLVWKGSAEHKNDTNRSLPSLTALAPLWSVPGVTFVSLQKGQGEEEATQSSSDTPILPLGSKITDFADTAAIVSQLDLVICVDTAIAHVAGALGKPCWVLIPFEGIDWRWLLDREDSPWYPGVMRLFRQSEDKSWSGVIDQVVNCLMEVSKGRDLPSS